MHGKKKILDSGLVLLPQGTSLYDSSGEEKKITYVTAMQAMYEHFNCVAGPKDPNASIVSDTFYNTRDEGLNIVQVVEMIDGLLESLRKFVDICYRVFLDKAKQAIAQYGLDPLIDGAAIDFNALAQNLREKRASLGGKPQTEFETLVNSFKNRMNMLTDNSNLRLTFHDDTRKARFTAQVAAFHGTIPAAQTLYHALVYFDVIYIQRPEISAKAGQEFKTCKGLINAWLHFSSPHRAQPKPTTHYGIEPGLAQPVPPLPEPVRQADGCDVGNLFGGGAAAAGQPGLFGMPAHQEPGTAVTPWAEGLFSDQNPGVPPATPPKERKGSSDDGQLSAGNPSGAAASPAASGGGSDSGDADQGTPPGSVSSYVSDGRSAASSPCSDAASPPHPPTQIGAGTSALLRPNSFSAGDKLKKGPPRPRTASFAEPLTDDGGPAPRPRAKGRSRDTSTVIADQPQPLTPKAATAAAEIELPSCG